MNPDAISICNEALALIGVEPISSFEDESREAMVCGQLYVSEVKAALARNWSFTRSYAVLAQLDTVTKNGFEYAYQLPTDSLRVITLLTLQNYQIAGNVLYCNQNPVTLQYSAVVPESIWPADFRVAFATHFAGLLAISLQEDASKMRLFLELADSRFRSARSQDAMATPAPAPKMAAYSLIAVRG